MNGFFAPVGTVKEIHTGSQVLGREGNMMCSRVQGAMHQLCF